jgi:putative transposase
MILSHKIQLDPTDKQITYFKQACGVSRFCYNWGLKEWTRQYMGGIRPNGMLLKNQFNGLYKEQFPWVGDVHRDAHAQPFNNLQKAMNGFFKKKTKFPKLKKKGRCRDSFYVANDKMHVDGTVVVLPVIGPVKLTEELRFSGSIQAATVSRSADRWFISIQVECDPPIKEKTGSGPLGIDLGVKTSVTCSDGSIYQSPKPLRQKTRRMKHLQKAVSRKAKGSNNRHKAISRLAKLHWRIENTRRDFIHKTTTDIVRKSQAVSLEDLYVRGMLSNHKLARAISEQGFNMFKTILTYKAKLYGVHVHVVDRFYPSSKTCSRCRHVKTDLKLSNRIYRCDNCGLEIERDLNASINLKNQLGAASPEVTPVDCQTT